MFFFFIFDPKPSRVRIRRNSCHHIHTASIRAAEKRKMEFQFCAKWRCRIQRLNSMFTFQNWIQLILYFREHFISKTNHLSTGAVSTYFGSTRCWWRTKIIIIKNTSLGANMLSFCVQRNNYSKTYFQMWQQIGDTNCDSYRETNNAHRTAYVVRGAWYWNERSRDYQLKRSIGGDLFLSAPQPLCRLFIQQQWISIRPEPHSR